ncbi:helix-turn-helix domain-containing protein [Streptomyces sp. NBC_00846]|uniref:helix-turn-helix domain-containing protein n=1 Tax=Streptomyces sp. NBC_00846 TaxID=2975849 RepID=UPI003868B14B|nr:helix-turn-helix domain-containing protein [Streptomyces sp. NBC_00846]
MPPRRFDRVRLRELRRAAEMHQRVLAHAIGLGSHVQVAKWEKGETFPPAEKLPGIARALGQDLDRLFPRDGDPDLVDVRCDAGFTQGRAADLVDEVSSYRLGAAERGERRLDEIAVRPLAELYQVSVDELLAAQKRSFGELVPVEPSRPRTLAEKLTELLQAAFPEGAPSSADVAAAVNLRVGSDAINSAEVEALRAGVPSEEIFTDVARAMAFEALGLYFNISPLHFEDDRVMERRVLDDIRYLAEQHQIALAARGGEGGLSDDVVAVLSRLVADEFREHDGRQTPGERSA